MKIDFKELVKMVEEVGGKDYQKSDRIKTHASRRMSTKGKTNKVGKPYSQDPPTARAKSAPPGFGFTMEELYKLIDEVLEEVGPSSTSAADHDPAHGGYPTPEGAEESDEEERGEEGEETGAPGILPDPSQDKVLGMFIALARSDEVAADVALHTQPTNINNEKTTNVVLTNTGDENNRDKLAKAFMDRFSGEIDFGDEHKRYARDKSLLIGVHILGVGGQAFERGALKISMKKGSSRGPKVTNRGDVAEGIVAAALAARFLKPTDEVVTKEEVRGLLKKLFAQPPVIDKKKKTVSKTLTLPEHETATEGVFDQVTLKVGLNQGAFRDLEDDQKLPAVDDLYDSSVLFANSSRYINVGLSWFQNAEKNSIIVAADGTADQAGTNVDIKITNNGQDVVDGEGKEIGGIGLKTSATNQLRQTNMTWGGLQLLFQQSFGVSLDEGGKQKYVDGIVQYMKVAKSDRAVDKSDKKVLSDIIYPIYQDGFKKLQSALSGDDDAKEKEWFETFIQGIKIAAMMEGKNIMFLSLGAREYKVLDYGKSLDNIAEKVNLFPYLERKGGETNYPYLYICDAGTKDAPLPQLPSTSPANVLIRIRPKMEMEGVKHYIEKGSRLEELILEERPDLPPQSPK